ncbi:MAG: baseplate J/gp47 family protein [Methylococcaceae bacterium]|nr:baseplate J/gp47 family protein [Methylococcaceae bacterium]
MREHRSRAELDPLWVQVEERGLPELLAFAPRYAELLSYCDLNGKTGADWSNFFAFDASFLLAEICTVDIQQEASIVSNFERLFNGNQDIRGNDKKQQEHKALQKIYQMAKLIDTWYQRAGKIAERQDEGKRIKVTLESLISKDLSHHYYSLGRNPQWRLWLDDWIEEDKPYEFDALWKIPPPKTAAKKNPSGPIQDRLIKALLSFNKAYATLVSQAKNLLRESLNKQGHPPHTALYIAFLKLLEQLHADLNQFTDRHLDYYYRQVLKLKERDDVADTAHLYFQLAKNVADYELKAGSLLHGGKDPGGGDRFYVIDEDVYLNKAKIASLKTLFVAFVTERGRKRVTRILASSAPNSEDGQGKPLKRPQLGWPTFGRDNSLRELAETDALHSHLGLLIASPVFLLGEGRRQIKLSFRFKQGGDLDTPTRQYKDLEGSLNEYLQAASSPLPGDEPTDDPQSRSRRLQALFADAFLLQVSAASGWFPIERFHMSRQYDSEPTDWVDFDFDLKLTDPAVVECRSAPHGVEMPPAMGGLRLLLNPQARIYAYSFLKDLILAEVRVKVQVEGLKDLHLTNNLGIYKPGQPFPPFGPIPAQGSTLEIGSRELSEKRLESVRLTLDWLNLPKPNFETYYQSYGRTIDDESFKARMYACSEGRWKEIHPALNRPEEKSPFPLFTLADQKPAELASSTLLPFDFTASPLPPVAKERRPDPPGLLRLELAEPDFGFGHEIFPNSLTRVVLNNSLEPDEKKRQALPNPPFSPLLKEISIDYVATERLQLDLTSPMDPREERLKLLYISPFGYSVPQESIHTLFSSYDAEGYLRIGLENLEPPQSITLLFHLQDSIVISEEIDGETGKRAVHWSYLCHDHWIRLDKTALIKDTTAGLARSGIVKLLLPGNINTDNRSMPEGLFWLQASVDRGAESGPNTLAIYTQAVTATRRRNESGEISGGVIPAETIKEFAQKMPAIASVHQPFPSTGGRPKETAEQFRTRVSERLRHKQRAIQPFDYERIVLDAFPEVGQVKCITWNNSQGYWVAPVEPGEIVMAVVPSREPGGSFMTPRLPQHVLSEIEERLKKYASSFVAAIRVRNPDYERIKLFVSLSLVAGWEIGPTVRRLNDEIGDFIAPWRLETGQPLDIGGGIGQGHFMQMRIENQPYVEFLNSLTLLHTYRQQGRHHALYWPQEGQADDRPIKTSAPWSVLVPAERHDIRVIVDETPMPEAVIGLSNLEVGTDLIVNG